MRFWILTIVLVVLTLSGGVLHGRLSNRWGPPERMVEAGARLQRVPSQIGSWQLESTQELDESARAMLECTGDFTRNYRDTATKDLVTVTLLLGPAGPISVHSPEICVSSRDFRQVEKRRRVEVTDASGAVHSLWKVTFRSKELSGELLNVYYAWSTGEGWIAAEDARRTFTGQPYLYKLQINGYPSSLAASPEDAVLQFLQVFLPAASPLLEHTPAKAS